MVWVNREIVYLECPFCHKDGVEAMYHPMSISANVSRSAVAKATRFHKVPEKYEIYSGCKFCSRTKAEINKAMKEGIPEDKDRQKKRLEELKKLGFSGVIGSKVRT